MILSGGDPLLLPDHLLERILKALRTIPHLELIRLGSRVPGTLPERITPKLCDHRQEISSALYEPAFQPSGRADSGGESGLRHVGGCRHSAWAHKPCF